MRIALVGAALGIALLGVACGGEAGSEVASLSEGGDTKQGSSTDEQDRQEQALEWAECMRKNGVDVPDPRFDDNGLMLIEPGDGPQPSEQEMEDAHAACQDLMPDPGNVDISPEERAAMHDASLEFAECMRAEGIDVPDPDEKGMAIPLDGPNAFDPEDPKFKAAEEKCHPILEEAMGGSGAGTIDGNDS